MNVHALFSVLETKIMEAKVCDFHTLKNSFKTFDSLVYSYRQS